VRQDERDELRNLTKAASALSEQVKALHEVITEDVRKDISDIKSYQQLQNGRISDTIKMCAKNCAWITALKWIMGSIVSMMIACLTKLYGLW
jgi:predicted RNA-binding Zn ribbon-like protein